MFSFSFFSSTQTHPFIYTLQTFHAFPYFCLGYYTVNISQTLQGINVTIMNTNISILLTLLYIEFCAHPNPVCTWSRQDQIQHMNPRKTYIHSLIEELMTASDQELPCVGEIASCGHLVKLCSWVREEQEEGWMSGRG